MPNYATSLTMGTTPATPRFQGVKLPALEGLDMGSAEIPAWLFRHARRITVIKCSDKALEVRMWFGSHTLPPHGWVYVGSNRAAQGRFLKGELYHIGMVGWAWDGESLWAIDNGLPALLSAVEERVE